MGHWWDCEFEPGSAEARQTVERLGAWSLALSVFAAVLMIGAALMLKHGDLESVPVRALVALLPLVPLAACLLVVVRMYRHFDELVRRIQFEALALTVVISILLAAGWGQLQVAKLAPDADVTFVWPAIVFIYGLCVLYSRRRYR